MAKPLFIVATKEFSGLGYAKMIEDAGYPCIFAYDLSEEVKKDPEEVAAYKQLGNGFVEKRPLAKMFAAREKFRDAY